MFEQFSGLLIHSTSTPPWLHRTVNVSTSSELYPYYIRLPAFLGCSGIQFFDSPHFPSTVGQATFGYLHLTVQHMCDLQGAMPMSVVTRCFSSNPYLGRQRISLGGIIIF